MVFPYGPFINVLARIPLRGTPKRVPPFSEAPILVMSKTICPRRTRRPAEPNAATGAPNALARRRAPAHRVSGFGFRAGGGGGGCTF